VNVPFQDLTRMFVAPWMADAFGRVQRSGQYILGEQLAAFEDEFAQYIGVRHCVGVANGLDALTLCLMAWDIGPGDEVLVPANTYIATWLAVSRVGARPIPVECDKHFVMDPDRLQTAITGRTRAVIPVHLYGMPCDMSEITEVVMGYNIRILEDCAQSTGARIGGVKLGSINAGAFSFYPTKNLGCMGDGGGITTNDPELASKLRTLRNYGSQSKYYNSVLGVNSRLDELQAAILRACLPNLDKWNVARQGIAAAYQARITHPRVLLPSEPSYGRSVWHLFPILCEDRAKMQSHLAAAGIETMVHYPVPPHLQLAYRKLGYRRGDLPGTERLADMLLSLPLFPHMRLAEIDEVIDAVNAAPV
jgi:dTDP-4-amino-4,6-dideoxygalactose transaminase